MFVCLWLFLSKDQLGLKLEEKEKREKEENRNERKKSSQLSISSVQSLSHVWLFVTPRTTTRQASLSITNSRGLPKLMSIESVMPSNHLISCSPLLRLPSVFPSIRVFTNESALRIRWPKYFSFSFNISPSVVLEMDDDSWFTFPDIFWPSGW